MNDAVNKPEPFGNLDARSDEELKTLIARAQDLLEKRERERKDRALAQIREIAKTHGLGVNVTTTKRRKRGRPRKKGRNT